MQSFATRRIAVLAPLLVSFAVGCSSKTLTPQNDTADGGTAASGDGTPSTGDAAATPDAASARDVGTATGDAGQRSDGWTGKDALGPAGDAASPPADAAGPGPGTDAGPGPGTDAGPARDGGQLPIGDGSSPPPGHDALVAPADAAGPPPPDPDAAFPAPSGRVCCQADAECDPGQHCSGGRCWDAIPTPACDAAHPCANGVCQGGVCTPACGCVEGSCAGTDLCITDDRACGICVPAATACTPSCERDLGAAEWAYLAPDPFQVERPEVFDGVMVADNRMPGGVGRRFEIEDATGFRQGFAYVFPAGRRLPFVIGEQIHAEISGNQDPRFDTRSVLSGPEGVRIAVIGRRGVDPTTILGLPIHLEDQGCAPTAIGNCIQQRPATLVFDVDGPRSPVAHTGDQIAIFGWDIDVARVYVDENACEPALRSTFANFVMSRGR